MDCRYSCHSALGIDSKSVRIESVESSRPTLPTGPTVNIASARGYELQHTREPSIGFCFHLRSGVVLDINRIDHAVKPL